MEITTRELFVRITKCEGSGAGGNGMKAMTIVQHYKHRNDCF
jgi:hypothetical protein